MNKQQFEALDKGNKFTMNGTPYKVSYTYPLQGIIMGVGSVTDIPIPFRYENCELVEQDRLVEYLKKTTMAQHWKRSSN